MGMAEAREFGDTIRWSLMIAPLQLTIGCKNELYLLIDDENDLEIFLKNYWTGTKKQLFSISKFREYKLENTQYTYNQFKADYNIDPAAALHKLFRRVCKDLFLNKVFGKLKNGEISLEEIYLRHKKNPMHRLAWIIN